MAVPAGAAEACKDFVGYGDDVVLYAEGQQLVQYIGAVHAHTGGALYERLEDERGYVVIRDALAEIAAARFPPVRQMAGR